MASRGKRSADLEGQILMQGRRMGRNRRLDVLSSAIELVGTHGEHALTHNKVDVAAGLPRGTTSNYFRSRDALLLATCIEIQQRRLAIWTSLLSSPNGDAPTTMVDLTQLLAGHVLQANSTGTAAALARAHNAFSVMAAYKPLLRDILSDSEREHRHQLHGVLQAIEPAWTQWRTHVLASYIAAQVVQQFSLPTLAVNAEAPLKALLDLLAEAPTTK